jgi:predicted acetylornithine/succinylornithine family transaminase
MANNARVIAKDKKYILQSYTRSPAALVKGRGSYAWDANGKRYLDLLTGITVNMLGHAHPRILSAAKAQFQTMSHVGNLFYNPLQVQLAEALVRSSFAKKVAFTNTGAEANELMIKVARKHGLKRDRHEIITFQGSFHGRTYGALSASGQEKLHKNMGPLLPGFRYARFNDLKSVEARITKKTCAIMVEPIQGEIGIRVGTPDFLLGLRRLCDRHGLLLMLDEIQTGLGRTGKMFCYQHAGPGFKPDVMSLGKALGGGLPLSAVLLGSKAEGLIGKGEHGTTMGGNPVACAAGLALWRTLIDQKLPQRAMKLGAWLMLELAKLQREFPVVLEVRGRGLMLGVELSVPAAPVAALAFKRGLIINATAGNILRLHPPLNVSLQELKAALKILRGVLQEFPSETRKG